MTELSAENISELNRELILLKQPTLELSDLKTSNTLRMLLFEMTLAPAYSLKVLSNWEGTKVHRYHMHREMSCFVDGGGC